MHEFLPVTAQEMKDRGWEQVDFVYLTGDAYVDHSSLAAHYQQAAGKPRLPVGIIPQPDWRKKESIQVFGEPRWVFL